MIKTGFDLSTDEDKKKHQLEFALNFVFCFYFWMQAELWWE